MLFYTETASGLRHSLLKLRHKLFENPGSGHARSLCAVWQNTRARKDKVSHEERRKVPHDRGFLRLDAVMDLSSYPERKGDPPLPPP